MAEVWTVLIFITIFLVNFSSTAIDSHQHREGVCEGQKVISMNTATWWTRPHLQSLLKRHQKTHRKPPPTEHMPANLTTSYDVPQGKHRQKRELYNRGPRYLELLLVIDNTVIDFHGADLVDQYLLTQLHLVDEVFHHPSLGIEININAVDIHRFSDRERYRTVANGDGRRTLDIFCRWVEQEKINRKGREKFDAAIYLTKDNIQPAGYAPVTGMCTPTRSCGVVRDDGLTSAFIMAHEIGHIIGMHHDGHNNRCQRDSRDGKIMGAMVQSSYEKYYWSDCSRQAMEKYMPDLRCLENLPLERNWPQLEQPLGASWSLNEQCRQEFGDGYQICHALNQASDPCSIMWCSHRHHPHFCKTKATQPLPGTSCGRGRWCMNGRCEAKRNVAKPGGWSSWLPWGSCSLTCGVGVQIRARTCTNPMPAHGGADCRGDKEQPRLCNKQPCPRKTDLRAELCARQNDINFSGDLRHSWVPTETADSRQHCRLMCESELTQEVMVTDEFIVDGALCSYKDPRGICVRGDCRMMGCDLVMNSNRREDRCGVCEGDSSRCTEISGTIQHALSTREYSRLITFPRGTRNIQIAELTRRNNAFFLALRDAKTEKWYLNGNAERQRSPRDFVVHGTLFEYRNGPHGERLSARGPLLQDLEFMVFSYVDYIQPHITYTFTVPKEAQDSVFTNEIEENDGRYIWAPVNWTRCSASCGGGMQEQEYFCTDTKLSTISNGMCNYHQRPPSRTRPCNDHSCGHYYRYREGEWETGCSRTCGEDGVQRRYLHCLAYIGPGMEEEVDIAYCYHLPRPEMVRPCNIMPCSTPQWVAERWSECSVTCGRGNQYREVYCDQQYAAYYPHFMCPTDTQPPSARECTAPRCIDTTTTTTTQATIATDNQNLTQDDVCRDIAKASYCLRFVSRYRCSVRRFKKVCCLTCTSRSFT